MTKLCIKDVACECTSRTDNPSLSGETVFVGLEHYDSLSPEILRHGSTTGLVSSGKLFAKGDILVARRNVYLKRSGLVNFHGVTSGDSIVLRPKKLCAAKLLPFILNTEDFWSFAEKHSDGTMSKRLSPKTLLNYAFYLPESDEQIERLSGQLWAIQRTIRAYKSIINKCDDLIKSRFVEMFGDMETAPKYPVKQFRSIATFIGGGTPSKDHPEYFGGEIPWISTPSLGAFYISKADAKDFLTKEGLNKSAAHLIPPYSIMIGTRVGVGKCSINTCPMSTNQDIVSLTDIDKSFDLLFVKHCLQMRAQFFESIKHGSTIQGIRVADIKQSMIPMPPIPLQKQFSEYAMKIDELKRNLQQAIEKAKKLSASILNSALRDNE